MEDHSGRALLVFAAVHDGHGREADFRGKGELHPWVFLDLGVEGEGDGADHRVEEFHQTLGRRVGGVAARGGLGFGADEGAVFGGIGGDFGLEFLAGEREFSKNEFVAADVAGGRRAVDREYNEAAFEVLAESVACEGAVVRGAGLERDLVVGRALEDRHVLRGGAGVGVGDADFEFAGFVLGKGSLGIEKA